MGKHAQLVIGPAGAGKSTYCSTVHTHCSTMKRTVHIVNLDPAAEHFEYPISIDIRELISLEDVMEELGYGPNGGLIYCMEYLMDNMQWLADQVNDYGDDYLIFDCPGQIELYSHLPVMKRLCSELQRIGYQVAGVYCIDSLVVTDAGRFIAGSLMCLSAMIQLELPHINVLTKCDLIQDKTEIDRFLDPSVETILDDLAGGTSSKFEQLNVAMGALLEDYSMVSFVPLDISDDESVELVLSHVDNAIQYGEDLEPVEPQDNVFERGLPSEAEAAAELFKE